MSKHHCLWCRRWVLFPTLHFVVHVLESLERESRMIKGNRLTRCDLAESCRLDDQCSLWLVCMVAEERDADPEPEPEPLPEIVRVKDDLL